MDDQQPYKLKIKIGQHEFEAEGPADIVQKQFQAFKDLIAAVPELSLPQPAVAMPSGTVPLNSIIPDTPKHEFYPSEEGMKKIMQVEGRTVSLTVRPATLDDAILLILYGQKMLRANELSTGAEVMDGLTATGGFSVARVDRRLERIGRNGDVIVMGEHRAKKYRLTNSGLTKVRQIAVDLLAIVA